MLRKAVIISFDLIRSNENPVSLSIASLLAYAKNQPNYHIDFEIEHTSINLCDVAKSTALNYTFQIITSKYELSTIDTIAISCYVWNEYLINPLLQILRNSGFMGKIVLGGYQIAYGAEFQLLQEYPLADVFIMSYGEESLVAAIQLKKPISPLFMKSDIDFTEQPSPYLSNIIQIRQNEKMVRLETKRGCPYRCTFCAHRDLIKNKVYKHDLDKIFAEIALFKSKNVGKINILDPVFNMGKDHLAVLQEMKRINLQSIISMQCRFEQIKGNLGTQFLELSAHNNTVLEFGLQTIVPQEYEAIERPNDVVKIKETMAQLNSSGIDYEISLIYGLPSQTVDSFKRSIDFAVENGCKRVVAFPLMLLKGTELYNQREKWNFKETILGDFDIPTVTSSSTFNNDDWAKMAELADNLSQKQRF